MAELRCYFVIHAATVATPTEIQWVALLNQTRMKPFASAIIQAARAAQNFISASKRSQNAAQLRRFTLCGFEIDSSTYDALIAFMEAQCTIRGITGTQRQKFKALIQAELQEAAVDLGYGAQAPNIKIERDLSAGDGIVGLGTLQNAINEVKAYLAANAGIWYA